MKHFKGDAEMDETRRVVEALMRVGPRFTDISKATGVPVSTVRYILLKKLPKLGLSVRASINYGALGLQRYLVEFRSSYPPHYISRLLDLMGEAMYLDYYTYLMEAKKFLGIFAVPYYYHDDFQHFIRIMKSLRLIDDYVIHKLLYMRPLPFMTDFFDFNKGVWRQDWIKERKSREIVESIEYVNPHPRITKIGLMILAELQENPIPLKLNYLAKKLKVTRQTIGKHFSMVKGIINQFTVFWYPHMNPELIASPITVRTRAESHSRQLLLNIPFTHAEFRTELGEYFAMLMVPSIGLYSTIKFITEHIESAEIDFNDMDYSGKFALQHNLYEAGSWVNVFRSGLEKLIKIIETKNRG